MQFVYRMTFDRMAKFEMACTNAGLGLNVQKCSRLNVTRKRNKIVFDYQLYNSALRQAGCEKDLDVWVNDITIVSNKANQLLGYIRRSTRTLTSISIRHTLYLSLVRSQFAYASQVWASQLIDTISSIEHMQRRATKYILNVPFNCDIDYKQRLCMANLLPLTYWHAYLDMVFLISTRQTMVSAYLIKESYQLLKITDQQDHPTLTARNILSKDVKPVLIKNPTLYDRHEPGISCLTASLKIPAPLTRSMFNYYCTALNNTYNPDDPRTWKSICLKCITARELSTPRACCF